MELTVLALHHVQLSIPRGKEDEARAFYIAVLGFTEVPKPENLAKRGGLWLTSGTADLHIGVEDDFRPPSKKAHPALLVDDLAALRTSLEAAGVQFVPGEPLEGYDRGDIRDPFGNRIELLQRL